MYISSSCSLVSEKVYMQGTIAVCQYDWNGVATCLIFIQLIDAIPVISVIYFHLLFTFVHPLMRRFLGATVPPASLVPPGDVVARRAPICSQK